LDVVFTIRYSNDIGCMPDAASSTYRGFWDRFK